MPWCPICKNEYKEGFTHCNDCDVDLVDSLEDGPKAIMFGSQSDMEEVKQRLLEARIVETALIAYDEKDKCYQLYVEQDKLKEAKVYLQELVRQEAASASENALYELEDSILEEEEDEMTSQVVGEYVDKKTRADDYKSSAYTLLLVGTIGLVALILHALGVIQFPIGKSTMYMMYIVMGALFIFFIVGGFLAFGSAKKFYAMSIEEKAFIQEAEAFLETVSTDTLDEGLSIEEMPEEMIYFKRNEKLLQILHTTYPQCSEELIHKLADDYYESRYGTES